MKLFKKIKKIISSTILCIRFPFLYPRNRFDGKHHANILSNLRYKLQLRHKQRIYITAKVDESNTKHNGFLCFFNYHVQWKRENNSILVRDVYTEKFQEFDLSKLVDDTKFEILGLTTSFLMTGDPIIVVHLLKTNPEDTTKYGFSQWHLKFIKSRWYNFWCKVVTWFDTKILDKILFLPSYTELNAMESGWRKAFGIQMCKEIKKELKKHKFLYKYRIIQIKEKWGYLHWYDGGTPKDSKIYDIIRKYEQISAKTCIVCGKPATKMSTGWICPYCDDCVVPGRNYTKGSSPIFV